MLAFLRVVEVFPPLFPARTPKGETLRIGEEVERFVGEAQRISKVADVVLVADLKSTRFLKFSTVEAALILKKRLELDAAPVIVLRDVNRQKFLSSVMTGISLGLKSMMIVWGDRYPAGAQSSNVRDFPGLAAALREASLLREKAHSPARFFAPVDLRRLSRPDGVALAKARLRAGADCLLAQPPTTDAGPTFERHIELLDAAGLADSALLNVFPFRDRKDVKECERYFGWRLPRRLHITANEGAEALFEAEKEVVQRLRQDGLPGVYLNARGAPAIVEKLLG